MINEPQSIDEHIECLARLTGAPDSFTSQVKELFTRKGITLESDATPYLKALEQAFEREESIRQQAREARNNAARLRDNFTKLGQTYANQLAQLKRIQASMRRHLSGKQARASSAGPKLRAIRVRGEKHVYTTRTVQDDLPMVPGPEDPQ